MVNKTTMKVWEQTKKTKEFKELKNKIQKALDEYKKTNSEPVEINIKLVNEYLGTLL
jgi:hypothetical protein